MNCDGPTMETGVPQFAILFPVETSSKGNFLVIYFCAPCLE